MDLRSIKNRATSKAGRQILLARKHSPTFLFGVGVAGVVTTAVLASRATLKMDDVLREAEEARSKIDAAKEVAERTEQEYTEDDAESDSRLLKVKTVLKIAKLYAPAVGVGVLTIAALTGSHVIISRRNVSLTAAYAALDQGFREYRKRVVDELGLEKDQEFRYGVIEKQIAVETDHGTDIKTVKVVDLEKIREQGGSVYARLFDEYCQNWSKQPGYNQIFLKSNESYANDLLHARGYVFLNDVFDMLGLERTPAGQIVGWLKGEKGGDGYIDFGIFRDDNAYMGMQFVTGNERSVLLDFNVDGPIWDKI
jgi:Family of unknown function (DUF6353)